MTKTYANRWSCKGVELRLVTLPDSSRPFSRSHVLKIRKGGDQRFELGPDFVAVLAAAVQLIKDDPNRKGDIPLCDSLILTCDPPRYAIGDAKGAPFIFPSLDALKKFVSDIAPHFARPATVETVTTPFENRPLIRTSWSGRRIRRKRE